MTDQVIARFREVAPAVDRCTLRLEETLDQHLLVRDGVLGPPGSAEERGAMITVVHRGGLGYAATSDLSRTGLARAARRAKHWAERTAELAVTDFSAVPWPTPRGSYRSPMVQSWQSVPLADKVAMLQGIVAAMGSDAPVVERFASLQALQIRTVLASADGETSDAEIHRIVPRATCVVHEGGVTQRRTFSSRGLCRQGGMEVLAQSGFPACGERIADEARQLLAAPECPSETLDLVLAPGQMMLQIHESIGHPLELDRILGDERNMAGTSFVSLDMFGHYRYGSELLDVTFDPTRPEQFASYGSDDEGTQAEKVFVIERGILKRPLGGVLSQTRAGLPGTANTRACSWNRPPIDRMANLNVEPGDQSLSQIIGSVERGVWMDTNLSWSIDDSRNKFQFGCEWAQLIEDGQLTQVVRNPNYRGISSRFWRSLSAVGDESTLDVLGTPFCGKGEPAQTISVGHASPVCRFDGVDVFGGVARGS
ncbi:MAG: TldD/PmbA family protein [Myxococcales bacterium]|nr:TldD/PmbA family protein [Myxococcales bacterium]